MKLIRTLLTLALAGAVVTAQAAPPEPQTTGVVDVKNGQTAIAVESEFFLLLRTLKIDLDKISPGKIVLPKSELRFPIVAGTIQLETAHSELIHSGGLLFSKKGESETTTVSVIDLILNIPAPGSSGSPGLTGVVVVNGTSLGRLPLFNLDTAVELPLEVPKNKKLALEDVAVTLTQQGADALNSALGTTFQADDSVGTAKVSATVIKGSL